MWDTDLHDMFSPSLFIREIISAKHHLPLLRRLKDPELQVLELLRSEIGCLKVFLT